MRRIRIVGLCLVAVFAMSAVVATGASAANPEYGRCLKATPKALSNYDSAKCTKLASERSGTEAEKLSKGNFKWYTAFGGEKPLEKTGFTAVLKPTTIATLETKSGTKVTCKALSAAGKYTGNQTVTVSKTDFSECESGGIKCNTVGAGTGVIKVNPISGELGLISKGETGVKDKIGNVLWPTGGKPETGPTAAKFVEFNCGGLGVEVRGAVISPVTSNSMKSIATVKFTAAKGVQKPTKFLGGINMYLESSFSKAPYEQSGQSATTLQTNEEKVEVRSL
jgi:hypothetical protein